MGNNKGNNAKKFRCNINEIDKILEEEQPLKIERSSKSRMREEKKGKDINGESLKKQNGHKI